VRPAGRLIETIEQNQRDHRYPVLKSGRGAGRVRRARDGGARMFERGLGARAAAPSQRRCHRNLLADRISFLAIDSNHLLRLASASS
jgi:hypothetical protein